MPDGNGGRSLNREETHITAVSLMVANRRRILNGMPMSQRAKVPLKEGERLCPWCERSYRASPDYKTALCHDCQADLMDQPKEVLIEMLARVAGVNVIAMASLAVYAPDSLDTLGLWDSPKREGFTRHAVSMKQLTRKLRRVQ